MFHQETCVRHDAWAGSLSWWRCQSPIAHSCSLLNHLNSFHGGMFKLNTKFDTDSLLYLLSDFECDFHTVSMLTEWHLLPPLTSTVKSSLFTHAHSSPLSLAAKLHQCHANHSRYIYRRLFCVARSSIDIELQFTNEGTDTEKFKSIDIELLSISSFICKLGKWHWPFTVPLRSKWDKEMDKHKSVIHSKCSVDASLSSSLPLLLTVDLDVRGWVGAIAQRGG